MLISILLFMPMLIFAVAWLKLKKNPNIWKNVIGKVEDIDDRKMMIYIFAFVILAQAWMVFLRKLPISADEVYTMSGASFFAGFNWSSYMKVKKFYNFGYLMLFAPLYKVLDDPVAIYRAMLFGNIVVQAFMAVIVYHILRKKLNCTKCFSLAVTFVSTCNAIILFFRGFMYNEMPLAIITWLIIWLLLELIDAAKRKRIVFSAVLGAVAAYAYIVHSRCIIIYGALAVLVFLFLLVYKKWLVQPVSFATVFTACIYFEKLLINYVQTNLYLKGSEVVMQNSVKHVMAGTWRYRSLGTWDGIKDLIGNFFSLSGALTLETGGLLTIATVIVLYYIIKRFKSYRKGQVNKNVFVITIFSMISLWGMVAAVALTGASNGKFRFLLYTRYFMPFLGPFLVTGLVLLKKYVKFNYKWVAIWSGVLTIIVGVTFAFYVYPILDGRTIQEITSFQFFFAFTRYLLQSKFSRSVFIIALGILAVFTGILLFLYKRKQLTALCMVTMIFAVALTLAVEGRRTMHSSSNRFEMSDVTVEVLKNEKMLCSKEIFCLGEDRYRKSILVSAFDKEIIYDWKEVRAHNDAVMFTNRMTDLSKRNAPYIYELDNKEWIMFWDEKLCDVFEGKYPRYQVVE